MSLKKLSIICFSVSIFIFSITLTFNNVLAQRCNPWDWHGGPSMIGGGIVFLFMLIFWVLVIIGLVLLIRLLLQKTSTKTESMAGGSIALKILEERYARGEIEKEEFEEKRQNILTG